MITSKNSLTIIVGILVASISVGTTAWAGDQVPVLPRPLGLDAAVTTAMQYNPSLQRTREKIKEQEGVLIEVKSARLPSLSVDGSASKTDTGLIEVPLSEDNNWKVAINVSQVLYAGGKVQAKVRSQREQLESAKLAYTAAINDTLLLVRQQFYTVLLDRQLILVREEAVRVLETELTNARNRQAAGSGSDFDVLRAEVAVANAKPPLIRSRNDYRVAQDKLRATLGVPGSASGLPTELDVQGTMELGRRDIALFEALTTARSHRPEIAQQDRLIKSASENITDARSGYLPSVNAVAGYEWTKPSLSSTAQSRLDGWTAGVKASWNFFEGRATSARVAQARSRLNQARHASDEAVLSVDVEVRQAHSALVEATELLAASEKVVAQARESLRMAKVRFDVGTASQLDVLQAQSSLTEAHSNLAQAQFSYVTALSSLERAIGSKI